MGGGPGRVPADHAGAPGARGVLHSQPGVAGGDHGSVRRDGDTVHHPGVPGVLFAEAPAAGDGTGRGEQASVALQTRLLGLVRPGVGRVLSYVCDGEYHPYGHQEMKTHTDFVLFCSFMESSAQFHLHNHTEFTICSLSEAFYPFIVIYWIRNSVNS